MTISIAKFYVGCVACKVNTGLTCMKPNRRKAHFPQGYFDIVWWARVCSFRCLCCTFIVFSSLLGMSRFEPKRARASYQASHPPMLSHPCPHNFTYSLSPCSEMQRNKITGKSGCSFLYTLISYFRRQDVY
jgi:hypothetical protein